MQEFTQQTELESLVNTLVEMKDSEKKAAKLSKEKDFNKRLKYIDDTFNELKREFGNNSNWAAHFYEQKMKAAFITLSDPAATDEDKEDAKKILDDIKRKVEKNETGKYDKYGFVKQIDDFLKDYEKHNKKK